MSDVRIGLTLLHMRPVRGLLYGQCTAGAWFILTSPHILPSRRMSPLKISGYTTAVCQVHIWWTTSCSTHKTSSTWVAAVSKLMITAPFSGSKWLTGADSVPVHGLYWPTAIRSIRVRIWVRFRLSLMVRLKNWINSGVNSSVISGVNLTPDLTPELTPD